MRELTGRDKWAVSTLRDIADKIESGELLVSGLKCESVAVPMSDSLVRHDGEINLSVFKFEDLN